MINLSKESTDLLLICLKNNPPIVEFVTNGSAPTVKTEDPIKYADEMIAKLLDPDFNEYTPEFYNTLRLVVTNEFCGRGLRENSEPNDYGLRLERLNEEIASLFM